ncbi:DUF2771 domain-containing protein [Streptomyces sp. NPDC058657]|uniref:DUF2771 domain-containing protein n=1 Tax=unclassified Streptomyces TaxID=2593676 RepID=UPI003652D4CE
MTVALFSGKARRTTAALAVASAGLLVLSACDKPTPLATVTVGSDSVHAEAACYEDGKGLGEKAFTSCMTKKAEKTIEASSGDTIRVGVDPKVAESGWVLFVNGRPIDAETSKKTYRTVKADEILVQEGQPNQMGQAQKMPLKEAQFTIGQINGKELAGVWHFKVKRSS